MGMLCKKQGLSGEALKWWASAIQFDPKGDDVWCSAARRETELLQKQQHGDK